MIKRKQKKSKNLGEIFDKRVKHEFIDHDVEATMKTMVNEPIVHNVPVLTGGVGFDNVFNFYKNQFVGKMPEAPQEYSPGLDKHLKDKALAK
jgi:carboxymethylenebutenolidase